MRDDDDIGIGPVVAAVYARIRQRGLLADYSQRVLIGEKAQARIRLVDGTGLFLCLQRIQSEYCIVDRMPERKHSRMSDEEKTAFIADAFEGLTIRQMLVKRGTSAHRLIHERALDAAFSNALSDALTQGMEIHADSLMEITQQYPDVAEARLISENIRWLLSRRKSKTYGDRLDVNVEHRVNIVGALSEARARAALHPSQHIEATFFETGLQPVAACTPEKAEFFEPSLKSETADRSLNADYRAAEPPPRLAERSSAPQPPLLTQRPINDFRASDAEASATVAVPPCIDDDPIFR